MARALERHVGAVEHLGPVDFPFRQSVARGLSFASRTLAGKRVAAGHRASLSMAYARAFQRRLALAPYDLIVAPAGSTPTAFLETAVPIVYVSDATFAAMVDYNESFTNLWPRSIREGNEIERRAIEKSTLALYASRWAADSALRDYGARAAKVHVVPFGANLDALPDGERVRARALQAGRCDLLLVGTDWRQKGGDIALDAMIALRQGGIAATLTVCGCTPPPGVRHPQMRIFPFIDKHDPGQFRRFEDLFWSATVLVLPTRAECYGIVLCEAAAFGVPSFGADTGGVRGALHEGVNGFLLSPGASGADYARAIAALIGNEAQYRALATSSRQLAETRLNWDAWARRVNELLDAAPVHQPPLQGPEHRAT